MKIVLELRTESGGWAGVIAQVGPVAGALRYGVLAYISTNYGYIRIWPVLWNQRHKCGSVDWRSALRPSGAFCAVGWSA